MIALNKVIHYAIKSHVAVNQSYDDKPYSVHINAVAKVAIKFQHFIPLELKDEVIGAAYCHDMIEDTFETYNDILKYTKSYLLSEIVFAVTNEKGRNRSERANDKYYKGIRKQQYASFIKLCDRIANVEYGKAYGSSMFKKYQKEQTNFMKLVIDDDLRDTYSELINYLEELLV